MKLSPFGLRHFRPIISISGRQQVRVAHFLPASICVRLLRPGEQTTGQVLRLTRTDMPRIFSEEKKKIRISDELSEKVLLIDSLSLGHFFSIF